MELSPLFRYFCLSFASLLAINSFTITAHARRPAARDRDTALLRAGRYYSTNNWSTRKPPVLTSLSPTAIPASSPTFSLQVAGANFPSGTVVLWNGTRQPTKRANNNLLYASVSSTLIAASGTAQISVLTPMATQSNAMTFLITTPTSAPLAVTTSSLPKGSKGLSYSASLAATGGNSPYGWSMASGSLPPGLALSTSGQISGTPSSAGTYSFNVQVSDSTVPSQSTTKGYTISVSSLIAPLAVSTTSLASGTTGTFYSATLAASGGTLPYSWSLAAGSLPAGLTLSAAGQISGTPTAKGTYGFSVRVSDSGGQTSTRSLSISIAAAVSPLTITTTSLPAGTLDAAYAAAVAASGGIPSYTWSIASGSLPPGLILGAATGQISGTPSSSGGYSFALRVADSGSPSQSATQSFSINVDNTPGGGGASDMLLTVDPTNPRYFRNAAGNIVYLAGSHTWTNVQTRSDCTGGASGCSNVVLANYIQFLKDRNLNVTRLWLWEQATCAPWNATCASVIFSPAPIYARHSSTCCVVDGSGLNKYDLDTWNTAYWDTLSNVVSQLEQNGIYAVVMMFQGWSVGPYQVRPVGNPWPGHPYHSSNNVNGVDGDAGNADGQGDETQTTDFAAINTRHDAVIEKFIDTLNGYNNIIWETWNEPWDGPYSTQAKIKAWGDSIISKIETYEAGKPKQHPILISAGGHTDNEMFASVADAVAPLGAQPANPYINDPPVATGNRVVLIDTDHLNMFLATPIWAWRQFTRGNNAFIMDDQSATFQTTRLALGDTRSYANRMNLRAAVPSTNICSTQYCLVNSGNEYLVFAPSGGSFTVNLSAGSGEQFSVEWFNVNARSVQTAPNVKGGNSAQPFTSPFGAVPSVLHLQRSSTTTP